MNKILVIEDEANIRANVLDLLDAEGFDAKGVESGRAGLAIAFDNPPSLVICDVMMPELDGWAVLRALRDNPTTANVPFIFLTAKAERSDVRRGMSLGADDYVTKPFTRTELLDAVRARLRRLAQPPPPREPASIPAVTTATAGAEGDVVMHDPAMKVVYAQATRAAQSTISVLILGETGVGKEVLANAIHRRSPRADKPFIALNCAALSETLLESELFGHEKGSFTGATGARPGLFEAANGGTVFLDEVGELPIATQAKLLRVLEDRRVTRIGARASREVDVRFVSATNRDLEADAEAGKFRSDVYFRLNGITVTDPAPPRAPLGGDRARQALRRQRGPAVRPGRAAGALERRGRGARALRVAGQRPRAQERARSRGRPLRRDNPDRAPTAEGDRRAKRGAGVAAAAGVGSAPPRERDARSARAAPRRDGGARTAAHRRGSRALWRQPDPGRGDPRDVAPDLGFEARRVRPAATAQALRHLLSRRRSSLRPARRRRPRRGRCGDPA